MSAEGFAAKGEACLAKGKPKEAINECSQAIAMNPKLAEAYYVRHLAYSSVGDASSAQKDAQVKKSRRYFIYFLDSNEFGFNCRDKKSLCSQIPS